MGDAFHHISHTLVSQASILMFPLQCIQVFETLAKGQTSTPLCGYEYDYMIFEVKPVRRPESLSASSAAKATSSGLSKVRADSCSRRCWTALLLIPHTSQSLSILLNPAP